MKSKIYTFVFIGIFLIGLLLRLYKLGDIPNSLDWDEVSQGYNAYSILQTGKDEYGKTFPFTIRSFNDYKTPAYTYISIPFIKLFGLISFGERLPSAVAGIVSIFLVYLLIAEIFYKHQWRSQFSLLGMFFFAVSPWSIQFSRAAFDANVGVLFVLAGTVFFLHGVRTNKTFLLLASIFFLGISVYLAHSEKIFTPIFLVFLFLYNWHFFINRKILVTGLLLLFFCFNLLWLFDSQTKVRSTGVLFTSSSTRFLEQPAKEIIQDEKQQNTFFALLHNRRFVYINKYLENYLSHFNLNYLFIYGDNPRHHAPGIGLLYLVSLPLIIAGTFFLIRNHKKESVIVFAWLFIAPLASSFAVDSPNYQRSLIFLPSWQILEAAGIIYILLMIKKLRFILLLQSVIIILVLLNIAYYLHQYFSHTNTLAASAWQYGYKEAILFVNQYNNSNKKVFFANDIEQGYMFYLFYTKYDPNKYLSTGGSNRINTTCYTIDNAHFSYCSGKAQTGDIYITSKENVSSGLRLIKNIPYNEYSNVVFIYEYL